MACFLAESFPFFLLSLQLLPLAYFHPKWVKQQEEVEEVRCSHAMGCLTACCPVCSLLKLASLLDLNPAGCRSTDKMLLNVFKEIKEVHENHNT